MSGSTADVRCRRRADMTVHRHTLPTRQGVASVSMPGELRQSRDETTRSKKKEPPMPLTRRAAGRAALAGMLAAPALLRAGSLRAAPTVLKISHQFPGGTIEQGDFRDRLVRRFAAAVQQRTRWRAGVRNLSGFVADEDRGAVLRAAPRRARFQPLSAGLCRRRGAGGEYRPDALPGRDLPAGPGLEDGGDRPAADRCAGQARGEDHHLDLAVRRRGLARRRGGAAGRRQGPEDPRRLARDGPDAEGGRRHHLLGAVRTRSTRRCRPARWMRR